MKVAWTALVFAVFPLGHGYHMSPSRREALRESAREMFSHGWDNYKRWAFPADELNPLLCSGRGRDRLKPLVLIGLRPQLHMTQMDLHAHALLRNNININDILGDYSLTLVDTLDTLPVMGNCSEFAWAVQSVIDLVSFDVDSKVQVFEANIRLLGGLLSGHIMAMDNPFGCRLSNYQGELLAKAKDLADRLMPAFLISPTGIPFPRVNLRYGVPKSETMETCTAGVGSLVLEFGVLSRLIGDPTYEEAAKTAIEALWQRRSNIGLFGNVINLQNGQWVHTASSTGAGIDSFFEYLLKAHVLFGEDDYLRRFDQAYAAILTYVRDPSGYLYRNVHMQTGALMSTWIDSLGAFLPGMQVMAGDLDNAIRLHLIYYNLWRKYGALPERFDFHLRNVNVPAYPLRPEFIESTYFLYRATKDPFYLHVGEMVMNDINTTMRVGCGFASLGNVITGQLEDRMESFALSETFKYLYLLFDEDNVLNHMDSNFVFTTEGHVLFLDHKYLNASTRAFRHGDNNVSPYRSRHVCQMHKRPSEGSLSADFGVKDSSEADFAALIVGYEDPRHDQLDANGICRVPEGFSNKVELILGPAPGMSMDDMLAPNFVKYLGGIFATTLIGVKLELMKRSSRHMNGYDVTQGDTLSYMQFFCAVTSRRYTVGVTRHVCHGKLNRVCSLSPGEYLHVSDASLPFYVLDASLPSSDNANRYSDEMCTLRVFNTLNHEHWDFVGAMATFGPSLEQIGGSSATLDGLAHHFPVQTPEFYACYPYSDAQSRYIAGKIHIVGRGDCLFSDKVYNSQQAGAIAVIIIGGNDNDLLQPSLESGSNDAMFQIPSLMITVETAANILHKMDTTSAVEATQKAAEAIATKPIQVEKENTTTHADPTTVKLPTPNPMHGSYHWDFERAIAVALIPLTVFQFSYGAHPLTDGLLGVILPLHCHIGLDAVITDYIPKRRTPRLYKFATWSLRIATVGVLYGCFCINTETVGMTELVQRLWTA
ncbi:hypothetical protein BZG36_04798 [Bifiguratus adelaidae]|uniref:alpha-1,2-Mannosidase n=1 Tax=Bifiguratus adelaidae TaxID=1938954 RepID=A0A261XUT5_9FUNG|nr:hypothetical protein BZG36_04798 [Bifiguratus adelaidae]